MCNTKMPSIVIIRVLSMFMIILCHTISYYTFIPGSQFLSQFFDVGVEVFFLISGYLYGKKEITQWRDWFIQRLLKIWLPVIITVLCTLTALYLLCHQTYSITTIIAYLLNLQGLLFIKWDTFSKIFQEIHSLGPLWFATIIMLCYCTIPLLQKVRAHYLVNTVSPIIIIGLCLAGIIAFFMDAIFNIALNYFIVYFVGYYLASLNFEQSPYNKCKFCCICFLAIFSLFLRLFLRRYFDNTNIYTAATSYTQLMLGCSIVFAIIELNKKFNKLFNRIVSSRIIRYLDHTSLYIYLIHAIFCMGSLNLYTRLGLLPATILFPLFCLVSSFILKVLTELVLRIIPSNK